MLNKFAFMPNGKTHDTISLLMLPVVIVGGYLVLSNLYLILILSLSYLFSSFMFNGDLDANTRHYNRWYVFKMVWIPYQLMFYHRSIFTHGILIGTIVRILYIGSIPYLLLYYGKGINVLDYLTINEMLVIFVGLELGNLCHSIPDWLT